MLQNLGDSFIFYGISLPWVLQIQQSDDMTSRYIAPL
jgi:hypothetical protein